jgi:leader peptidase (prepilin peptidase)/N-methyltransferase
VGSLLGAVLGAGFMHGVGITFGQLLGREAMGFGDVKMMGMIGAVAGWEGLLVTLVVALSTGSAVGLVYMAATGRPQPTGADLAPDAPAGRRWVLRLVGARQAPDDRVVRTWPGTSLVVRLATGEPSIPFGPFLALGAAVAVFVPNSLEWVR